MPAPACPEGSPGIRVLLVDDSQPFLRVAADFLGRHPELVLVGAVCGGEDALIQIQSLQPQVVLIGLDTLGLAGLKMISRLRITLPEVAIIALTMLSDDTARRAAFFAGADGVVTKAHLSADLLPVIRRVV